ncbi:hypothetical protein FA13DRAFT_1749805, partial [Coprinellus micaceus]
HVSAKYGSNAALGFTGGCGGSGAIYMQHGGSIAHRVFHTRMLPHLLVRGGLPTAFHAEAEALAKRNLLHALGKTQFNDSPSPSSSASSHSSPAS